MRTLKPDREVRFRALYANGYGDVLRFAQRRVHPAHAEDVTAARVLGVTASAYRVRLLRARRSLRRQLGLAGSLSYAPMDARP